MLEQMAPVVVSGLMSNFQQTDSAQHADVAAAVNQVVHPLVACDVCDRPIVGVRYKCG